MPPLAERSQSGSVTENGPAPDPARGVIPRAVVVYTERPDRSRAPRAPAKATSLGSAGRRSSVKSGRRDTVAGPSVSRPQVRRAARVVDPNGRPERGDR